MKRLIAFALAAAAAFNTLAQAPQPPEIAARNYLLLDTPSWRSAREPTCAT